MTSAGEPAAQLDASRPKRGVGAIVKIVFGVAVVVFGIYFFASRWDEISAALAQADWGWTVAAVVLAAGSLWLSALGTRALLELSGEHRIPVAVGARIFFVSQLGKYLPGSIWPLLAVAEMGRKEGIGRKESATAGALALFLSLITGGAVGIVVTLAGTVGADSGQGRQLWWLALLLPVIIVLASPKLVLWAVNRAFRLIRRDPIEFTDRSRGRYYLAAGLASANWLGLGLHCWALCVALGGQPDALLLGAIGGFALAYTAGTLFIPAPAGAGVREAVLGMVLTATSTGSGLSAGAVLAVLLLSRAILAVLDFATAGVAMLLYRRHQRLNTTTSPVPPLR